MQNSKYTLNKISNWSLFKLIISDQVLITLKCFLRKYVQFHRQKFSGLSDKLSFNPQFFVFVFFVFFFFWLKIKKKMLFKKMVLDWSGLANFKKYHTLEIWTKLDFLRVFLNIAFFNIIKIYQ